MNPLKHELGLEFGVITDFFSFYASEGAHLCYENIRIGQKNWQTRYGYRFGKHLQFQQH